MKFATISKSLVLGLALLLAVSAFAGSKSSLQLSNAVLVNGTTLKAGEYNVQWEGSGPNVEVSFLQGKNVVLKAPAHLVELQAPAANDAAVTQKNDKGPNSLSSVRFQGKKIALELDQTTDAMHNGSSE